jgi:hypothetical protein
MENLEDTFRNISPNVGFFVADTEHGAALELQPLLLGDRRPVQADQPLSQLAADQLLGLPALAPELPPAAAVRAVVDPVV